MPRIPLAASLIACLGLIASPVAPLTAAETIPPGITRPIPAFAGKGLHWLLEAQHPDGGWGAGSHANQNLRDPHAVQTDPATTAFVTMALMRLGHSTTSGEHRAAVRRAVEALITAVESAPAGPRITELENTQIQAKLGPLIDTAITAQCLARALGTTPTDDPLYGRLAAANASVIAKLETAQDKQGHWGGGGWAPVLQSSAACTALELASINGVTVDAAKLDQARRWQAANAQGQAPVTPEPAVVDGVTREFASDGPVSGLAFAPMGAAAGDAGVELYRFSAGQRGNVVLAKRAETLVAEAKRDGRLDGDAEVSEESLRALVDDEAEALQLAASFTLNEGQKDRLLNDERLLAGFGNNGGEEYLSYLMTSESLCIDGDETFDAWQAKMIERLPKAQNADGSWSGHHCTTSPVFCTAAVIQVVSVANDRELLARIADSAVAAGQAAAP